MLAPLSVSLPAVSVSPPPVLPITPEYVLDAFVSVRVRAPSVTPPAPDSVAIEAPEVVPEISKVPASATPLDVAIEPEVNSANVPALIVVAPV